VSVLYLCVKTGWLTLKLEKDAHEIPPTARKQDKHSGVSFVGWETKLVPCYDHLVLDWYGTVRLMTVCMYVL